VLNTFYLLFENHIHVLQEHSAEGDDGRRGENSDGRLALGLGAEVLRELLPVQVSDTSDGVEDEGEGNGELGERGDARLSDGEHGVGDIHAEESADSDAVHADGEEASGHTVSNRGPRSQRKGVNGNVRGERASQTLALLNVAHRSLLLLCSSSPAKEREPSINRGFLSVQHASQVFRHLSKRARLTTMRGLARRAVFLVAARVEVLASIIFG